MIVVFAVVAFGVFFVGRDLVHREQPRWLAGWGLMALGFSVLLVGAAVTQ